MRTNSKFDRAFVEQGRRKFSSVFKIFSLCAVQRLKAKNKF